MTCMAVPIFRCLTPDPTLTTFPLPSWPIIMGFSRLNFPHFPYFQYFRSDPQIPTELMDSRTSGKEKLWKLYKQIYVDLMNQS